MPTQSDTGLNPLYSDRSAHIPIYRYGGDVYTNYTHTSTYDLHLVPILSLHYPQNKSVRVGNIRYTLNTELLRPSKKDPAVFEGWLIGRIESIDVPASSPLLKADTTDYTTRGYICLLPGADRPQCRHMTDWAYIKNSATGGASFDWVLPETFFFWIQNAACSKLRVKFNFHTQYNRSSKDLNAYSSFPAIATINIPYAGADVLAEDDGALFQPKSVTEVTETFIEAEKIWEDERTEQLARVFMRFDAEEPGYIPNHLLQPLVKALKVQSWDIPSSWEEADAISFVEVAQWWNDEDTRHKLQRTDEYVRRFRRWSTDGELNSTGVRHLSQELGMDPERAVRDMSVDHGEFVSMPQFMDWANEQESDKEFSRPASEDDEPALLDSLKEQDTQLSTDVKAALEALNSQLVHVRHMAAMIQQTRHDPAMDPDKVASL